MKVRRHREELPDDNTPSLELPLLSTFYTVAIYAHKISKK